jgi:8-amino-7-oxononanoate synthase
MLDARLSAALESRIEENSLRKLVLPNSDLVDFASNDYLGLARSTELTQLIIDKANQLKQSFNGSTGSRLLTGNSSTLVEAEQFLSAIFNAESTLLFPSGYMANLAVLSSLPKRGDTIFYDQYAHASLKDGIRLSQASRLPFLHNNLSDLEKKIKKTKGQCFVIVESIYSMDGDASPLVELVELCSKYEAVLVVDEAHSTGVMGLNGNGMVCELGLESTIPIRIYTFGKAMGVHGACVAGSKILIDYLTNFARPFIYTTAPDNHSVISITSSFQYLKSNTERQWQLRQNIQQFLSSMRNHPVLIKSESAIQSLLIPGNTEVKRIASFIQERGFDVRPILSPTVAAGTERIRIILHSFNSSAEIQNLCALLHSLSSR